MRQSTINSCCSFNNEVDNGDGSAIRHVGSTPSTATAVDDDAPLSTDTHPTKSIGLIGSFALIANTCSGPAIGAFPLLFQQAGIIPVTATIALIFIISTLSSTLLADTISKLPGNRTFSRNVSYSRAFRIIMGDEAYILAESLFLISCGVQAVAAIVAVAQSIDSLLSSVIIGHTYALQVLPSIQLINWSPALCNGSVISKGPSSCIPFKDDDSILLISLGFMITTAMFLPFGRGLLKETITLQIAVFMVMVMLLIKFNVEFISRGLSVEVPWFGSDLSNVAGVVLFNYGFIVGVPAWLVEKETNVSVNTVLWSSTGFSSISYIVFGILGAMSFSNVEDNVMVMLTSTKVQYVPFMLPYKQSLKVNQLNMLVHDMVLTIFMLGSLFDSHQCDFIHYINDRLRYTDILCADKSCYTTSNNKQDGDVFGSSCFIHVR